MKIIVHSYEKLYFGEVIKEGANVSKMEEMNPEDGFGTGFVSDIHGQPVMFVTEIHGGDLVTSITVPNEPRVWHYTVNHTRKEVTFRGPYVEWLAQVEMENFA